MGWIEYLINYPDLVITNNIHSESEAIIIIIKVNYQTKI